MKQICLVMMAVVLMQLVSANSIYTDQINFEPNVSRLHNQIISADTMSDIKVIVDSNFTVVSTIPVATTVGNNISWANLTSAEFSLTSPANCTEGKIYRMPVYLNNNFFDFFTFLCIPDEKIVDYKAEYGHGDGNYLDFNYPYLPDHDVSLFNLIRVYTYGSYINPNEDALNASIDCVFPSYLVMTRQHNEGSNIIQENTQVNALFHWDNLGGNWFRLAPLEQEITGLKVGDFYNITCGNLTYYYSTGRIRATFKPISFEIRNTTPFIVSVINTSNSLLYTIKNNEKYPITDIELLWKTNTDSAYTEKLREMMAGESVGFEVFLEGNGLLTLDATYVPSWQKSSLKPQTYAQYFVNAFNYGGNNSLIDRVVSASSSTTTKRVTLTHFPDLFVDGTYKARLVLEANGNPIDADSNPSIIIKDPLGVLYTTSNMTHIGTGIYEYNISLINATPTHTIGVWITETYTTYLGVSIPRFDYWDLKANPAQVKVETVGGGGGCTNSVTGKVFIQNEGTGNQEYQYRCWVAPTSQGLYDDADTINKVSGAKMIVPQELWSRDITMDLYSNTGTLYFKCQVFFGEDSSSASVQFDAKKCLGVSQLSVSFSPAVRYTLLGVGASLTMMLIFAYRRRRQW